MLGSRWPGREIETCRPSCAFRDRGVEFVPEAVVEHDLRRDLPAVLGIEIHAIARYGSYADLCALRKLGWEPKRRPAESVAAYAAWLEGMDGLDEVLAEANARMRALGVVRKAAT